MTTFTTGNEIVDAMASMQITGNVIPQIWYRQIQKDTGKPDLLAIALLADIVYWYRPQEVRNEISGQITGYRKRIADDLLQRSYDQFALMFGETKRAVQEAIVRLEKLRVIKRVFRTVEFNGARYSNVLYIELFPDRLFELTYPKGNGEALTKKRKRYHANDVTYPQKIGESTPQECGGYYQNTEEGTPKNGRQITKNTKEITTEIISSSSISPPKDEDDDFKMQIDYQNAYERYGDTAKVIHNELCKGDNRDIAVTVTKQIFEELCKSISEYASPIRNLSAYIRVCLSNMATGQKIKRKCSFNQHMTRDDVSDWEDFEKSILAN